MDKKIQPTIGRIVHFVPPSENVGPKSVKLVAAIVTNVHGADVPVTGEHHCDLATFGPNSLYFQHMVPWSEEPKPGHWSWPPRT